MSLLPKLEKKHCFKSCDKETIKNGLCDCNNRFFNNTNKFKMKNIMTYNEAEKEAFKVKWKVETCSQGDSCWCRIIAPVEPIYYMDCDDETEYTITYQGELNKTKAEYFVKLHNENLKT